jgi:sugar phosphate isomerase/epimerase
MSSIPISLQMYTVRDKSAVDFAGTMRAVAEIGYEAVELASTGGLSAADLKALLDDCGLACVGSHVGFEELEADPQPAIDYALGLGTKWITIPWLGEQYRPDAAAWKAMGPRLAALGAKVKAAGLYLSYHNHSFEFTVSENGVPGLDLLYANAPADLLGAEIDTYWVQHGGQNPAAYVKRYGNRAALIHLKDMTPGTDPTFTEIGNGILDFPAIFAAAEGGIVAAWIVEQDTCARDSLESAAISFANLKKLLGR